LTRPAKRLDDAGGSQGSMPAPARCEECFIHTSRAYRLREVACWACIMRANERSRKVMRNSRKVLAVILVGALALGGVAFGGVAFTSIEIVVPASPPTAVDPPTAVKLPSAVKEILARGGFSMPAADLPQALEEFLGLVTVAFSPAHLGHPEAEVSDVSYDTYTEFRDGVLVTLVTVDSFDTTARTPHGWADFALDITTWTEDGVVYREKSLDFSARTPNGDIDFSMNVTTRTENGVTTVIDVSSDKSVDDDEVDDDEDEDEDEDEDDDLTVDQA